MGPSAAVAASYTMKKLLLSKVYMRTYSIPAAVGLGLAVSVSVFAQDSSAPFTLFEPIETQQSADNRAQPVVARNTAPSSGTGPIFTLVGTSRIGERRTVIVRHSSGEEIMVPLREFGATPIPGYESFNVVGADAANLSIRYPSSTSCSDYSSEGVRCSAEGNVALLSLTTAAPIVRRQAPVEPTDAPDAVQGAFGEAVNAANNVDERNPFAVLRERALNGDVQAGDPDNTSRRFRPRRIAPEDVPPGFRVVSTPFGDRLVED
jgi:hypothetical protein